MIQENGLNTRYWIWTDHKLMLKDNNGKVEFPAKIWQSLVNKKYFMWQTCECFFFKQLNHHYPPMPCKWCCFDEFGFTESIQRWTWISGILCNPSWAKHPTYKLSLKIFHQTHCFKHDFIAVDFWLMKAYIK